MKIRSHPVQLRTLVVLHGIGDKARDALPEIKELASSKNYMWSLNTFINWTAADIVKNLNP